MCHCGGFNSRSPQLQLIDTLFVSQLSRIWEQDSYKRDRKKAVSPR